LLAEPVTKPVRCDHVEYPPSGLTVLLITESRKEDIMNFAKEEGLKEVQISGVAVINKSLEKKMIKNGWQLTEVKVGEEIATAYTKTFKVK